MLANEVISWRRKWARLQARPYQVLDRLVADPTGEVDRRDALLRQLALLPGKQRAALVLRFYEDLSDSEIAEALGCSPATVRVHVHRALATLRVAAPETLTRS
jgi:RNA polymerase sigma factor (sigma-70 family)